MRPVLAGACARLAAAAEQRRPAWGRGRGRARGCTTAGGCRHPPAAPHARPAVLILCACVRGGRGAFAAAASGAAHLRPTAVTTRGSFGVTASAIVGKKARTAAVRIEGEALSQPRSSTGCRPLRWFYTAPNVPANDWAAAVHDGLTWRRASRALRVRVARASRARRARFARGQTAKTSIFPAPAAGGEEQRALRDCGPHMGSMRGQLVIAARRK